MPSSIMTSFISLAWCIHHHSALGQQAVYIVKIYTFHLAILRGVINYVVYHPFKDVAILWYIHFCKTTSHFVAVVYCNVSLAEMNTAHDSTAVLCNVRQEISGSYVITPL